MWKCHAKNMCERFETIGEGSEPQNLDFSGQISNKTWEKKGKT